MQNQNIKDYLDKGVFIRAYYDDKFVFLLKDSFFKKLKIHHNKKTKNKYYDILRMKEFKIDDVFITAYDFFHMPQNLNLDIMVKEKINIYDIDEQCKIKNIEYIKALKHYFRISYKDFLKTTKIKNIDDLILRFYPNEKKVKNENFKNILRDQFCNIFHINEQTVFKDNDLPEAFLILGVSKENVNCGDPVFIKALKKAWFDKIIYEKNKTINELKNVDISSMPDDHRYIFEQETNDFITILNQTIKLESLNNLKTPVEIISYWPNGLPKPHYVYG